MLRVLTVFSLVFLTTSISLRQIQHCRMVSRADKSLVNVTQDQCSCEMLRSEGLIVAANYLAIDQTCDVFFSNVSLISKELDLNSTLLFLNRTSTANVSSPTTPDPCPLGNLRWNSTGITVLGRSTPIAASGVFIDSEDNLYAVDETIDHVVWKLASNTAQATIVAGTRGSSGSSSSQLNYPNDVYVDRNGDTYVSDCYNHRVQKFINGSLNGVTIAGGYGSAGSALNQLHRPRYLTFDSTDTYMFVADSENNRIMRFSTSSTGGNSDGTVVAGGNVSGNTNTLLAYPWGIHFSPSLENDLLVTNSHGHSVMRWMPGASSGTLLAGSPGVAGSDATLLNTSMGIKIDAYLNTYVADFSNHRVQLFCVNNPTGVTIAGTGVAGSEATQLDLPRGVALDSQMNLYVGDSGNRRVQKFMQLGNV